MRAGRIAVKVEPEASAMNREAPGRTGIVANTRSLLLAKTGVQRYTQEVLRRLPADTRCVYPPAWMASSVRGHLWEQGVLPARLPRDTVLWSPSNSGPLAVRAQVVTIHDIVPFDQPANVAPLFGRWYRWLLPRLARRVRAIITVSAFSGRRIVDVLRVPPEKVHVVPNGVDDAFRRAGVEDAARVRQALQLPGAGYVLALGSVEPRKNLGRLLEAWKAALASLPGDLWLLVTGTRGRSAVFGDYQLPSLPPRVILTGRVEDEHLPGLYAGARAFVYVSVYEGFGLPVLEAMAAGTACVTSAGTSMEEVAGDAALLVDPLRVEEIQAGLSRCATDSTLCAQLAARGRARALQYSWDRTARETLSVLVGARESDAAGPPS
jgi:glycosyltransferase involved in cell wall biosynthesis